MKQRTPRRPTDLIILALAALAGAALLTLVMVWNLNRDNRWVRIVSPTDEKAVELVALNRVLDPFVKTESGNIYFCSGGDWHDSCVQVTPGEVPVTKVHLQWLTCGDTFPDIPAPPGAVVDAIAVGRCAEAATYAKVVILDDGTIWQWRRTFSWVRPFALGTSVILGLLLGFFGGKFILKLARALR